MTRSGNTSHIINSDLVRSYLILVPDQGYHIYSSWSLTKGKPMFYFISLTKEKLIFSCWSLTKDKLIKIIFFFLVPE